jgi:transcriptional regulator with XRE-family HTH domain
MKTSINEKVAAWRETMGLNQAAAAAHLGMSAVVFNRVELGSRFPSAETAALFIKAGVFSRDEWAAAMLEGARPASQDCAA